MVERGWFPWRSQPRVKDISVWLYLRFINSTPDTIGVPLFEKVWDPSSRKVITVKAKRVMALGRFIECQSGRASSGIGHMPAEQVNNYRLPPHTEQGGWLIIDHTCENWVWMNITVPVYEKNNVANKKLLVKPGVYWPNSDWLWRTYAILHVLPNRHCLRASATRVKPDRAFVTRSRGTRLSMWLTSGLRWERPQSRPRALHTRSPVRHALQTRANGEPRAKRVSKLCPFSYAQQ